MAKDRDERRKGRLGGASAAAVGLGTAAGAGRFLLGDAAAAAEETDLLGVDPLLAADGIGATTAVDRDAVVDFDDLDLDDLDVSDADADDDASDDDVFALDADPDDPVLDHQLHDALDDGLGDPFDDDGLHDAHLDADLEHDLEHAHDDHHDDDQDPSDDDLDDDAFGADDLH